MKPASFSQKLWRFSADPHLEVAALIEPMHNLIRQEMAERPSVLLAIHDWSTLSFGGHASKTDRVEFTHANDVGYDLANVLMVRGDDGAPIAPALVSLTTAEGVLGTARRCAGSGPLPYRSGPRGHALRRRPEVQHTLGSRDRPRGGFGQSLAAMERRDGHLALVRTDDRKVLCAGQETSLVAIADRLRQEDAFKDAGTARYHGRRARLYVAETEVVLHRPGKRNVGKKKIEIPGPPLPLRLVVTEVRDSEGRVLARWLLLTNVPAALGDTATIARWYYFRWRIETYHKLLKGAGWQLESWLQRDGQRLLVKLMLALAACASIWALERRGDAEAEAFKKLLMQLSGRQTKRNRAVTTSGLLAGLWVLQCAVGPARSPRTRRTQRHVGELLARICKEQWMLILL